MAGFVYTFCQPFINGCDQAIWQTKVPLEVQGRVFATRRAIEHASGLLAYLAAGPLADRVFGPLLAPDGALAASIGPIMGVGPGRGIGLLFVVMGLATLLISLWGNLSPRIRLIEDDLPDAVADEAEESSGVLAVA
jgi:DHA3 family macrolide efflux protein-like MFS transporter